MIIVDTGAFLAFNWRIMKAPIFVVGKYQNQPERVTLDKNTSLL
ncbi:hypothetical protein [Cuspidothrix issatschenkoi]|nr:hypothetical protein [Cuspidothrix issatschenkoi]